MRSDSTSHTKRLIIVGIWFALALIVGASGILESLLEPRIQAILFGLTALVLLSYWRVRSFKGWVDSLPIKTIIAAHLSRFVGFYFLFLYGRCELPYQFAVIGGWGDIIVATLAILVLFLPTSGSRGRIIVLAWNTIGLADILFVVITAGRLALTEPQSMIALTHLPMSLLPLFLVPIIIATHIIIFARLRTQ